MADVELTPVEITEAMTALRNQTRVLAQIYAAMELYDSVQRQCVRLEAKKNALNKELAEKQEKIRQSHEAHLASIRRYEQEREEKLSEQTVAFEREKALLDARLAQLKDDTQQHTIEIAATRAQITKAQTDTEEHLQAFDDLVAERKAQVDKEMAALEAPLHKARDEYEQITAALNKLRQSVGMAAHS